MIVAHKIELRPTATQGEYFRRCSGTMQFAVNSRSLRIQGLKEQIPMRERIRFAGTVKSVTIKLYAGKWYASFLVETEERPNLGLTQKPSVGLDFGLKVLVALSNGEIVENSKPLKRSLRKLRRCQRRVSRRFVNGAKQQSNRYAKAVAVVARIHKKVANQRSAAQHEFTSDVVQRFSRITIEDLNVSGMLKNRKSSRSISDASWGSLRRMLEYKCKMAGVELVVADRWFASSKTCSCCGHKVEKLSLSQRTFSCPCCWLSLDRDLNAAKNLDCYVATDQGETINARRRSNKTSQEAGSSNVVTINPNS